ncbi:MAG: uroporphyrinogen-III synthase [Acidimicrobiales bacterium]
MPTPLAVRPLQGFTVAVTADRRSAEQIELFARRGAKVLHAPTMATQYLDDEAALRRATEEVLALPPDIVIVTTGIGLRAWFETAQGWGVADQLLAALRPARLVARGVKAAAAARQWGLEVALQPPSERLDDAVALLLADGVAGQRIVVQEHGQPTGSAAEDLTAAGAEVVPVPVYRWRLPDDPAPAFRLVDAVLGGDVDAVTFTSAPAVSNLFTLADLHDQGTALRSAFNSGRVVAGCVGSVCAGAARDEGVTAPVFPDKGRLGLLVRLVSDELVSRCVTLDFGGHLLVLQGTIAILDGSPVELPSREAAVLAVLAERPCAVVGKTTLANRLWGVGSDPHAVEVAVNRLRGRLGPAGARLVTVRGRGYRLDARSTLAVDAPAVAPPAERS